MASVISGDANVSAAEFGYLDGVTSGLQSQIDGKLNLAGGKILQIVRATDAVNRSTTSTSYADAGNLSVTITPQKSDSSILILCVFPMRYHATGDTASGHFSVFEITDASNNPISGAQEDFVGQAGYNFTTTGILRLPVILLARATPATTSAVTYKVRFRSIVSTVNTEIMNADSTGQIYALEISA